MKAKLKSNKVAHTPNTKFGMGDFYGSGKRNPMGKVRDGMGVNELAPKKLKKPPKSLA